MPIATIYRRKSSKYELKTNTGVMTNNANQTKRQHKSWNKWRIPHATYFTLSGFLIKLTHFIHHLTFPGQVKWAVSKKSETKPLRKQWEKAMCGTNSHKHNNSLYVPLTDMLWHGHQSTWKHKRSTPTKQITK